MSAFIDARTIPAGTTIDTDLAIIGGGPAGISLALALAPSPIRMVLLESGAMHFDGKTQDLYAGTTTGYPYLKLEGSRLRYLGGSTNHWGGWCRPLDPIDFETRDWLPHSGWPFPRKEIEPYFKRAQSLVEAGAFVYEHGAEWLKHDRRAARARRWRRLHKLVPVQQDARQRAADPFRHIAMPTT